MPIYRRCRATDSIAKHGQTIITIKWSNETMSLVKKIRWHMETASIPNDIRYSFLGKSVYSKCARCKMKRERTTSQKQYEYN